MFKVYYFALSVLLICGVYSQQNNPDIPKLLDSFFKPSDSSSGANPQQNTNDPAKSIGSFFSSFKLPESNSGANPQQNTNDPAKSISSFLSSFKLPESNSSDSNNFQKGFEQIGGFVNNIQNNPEVKENLLKAKQFVDNLSSSDTFKRIREDSANLFKKFAPNSQNDSNDKVSN